MADVLAQAELVLRGISVPVGEKLTVVPWDIVRVHMTVDYRGPAINGKVRVAIGWDTGFPLGFLEPYWGEVPVNFGESIDFVPYEITCDVTILPPEQSFYPLEFAIWGYVLDMYAKIMAVPGPDIFTPTYQNIIEVELFGVFQNFAVTNYDKV